MSRIVLCVLHFRLGARYVEANPPFASIEMDHSDSAREGCAVSTLTILSEPCDWRGAVQVHLPMPNDVSFVKMSFADQASRPENNEEVLPTALPPPSCVEGKIASSPRWWEATLQVGPACQGMVRPKYAGG